MEPGNGNGKVYLGIPRERIYLPVFVDNRDAMLARLHESGLGCGYFQAEGHRVDRNRDTICREFLKHPDEPEWLVMIDSDMEHPVDLPERLIRWKKHIVGGLYFHRGKSHDPFAFRNGPDMQDEYGRTHRSWAPMRDEVYDYLLAKGVPLRDGSVCIMDDDPEALVPVDAVATGAMCLHRSVIEKMLPGPWFEYISGGMSEDLVFCAKAKEKYGYEVYCDFSTISGHFHWVPMGQSQFRMNYENRGINLTVYSKRNAAEMYAQAFDIPEEDAVKEIEAGNAHMVGDYWKERFPDGEPTKEEEDQFYKSPEVGKLYAMELLHWNFTPDFTMLRQMLTHIRRQNVIELGAGIGTVSLQMVIQLNNCLAVEINPVLQDFIKMRHEVIQKNVETNLGDLKVLGEEWMVVCKDDYFDAAIALDVLEHLPLETLWFVVKNMNRVLKMGGHFIYHANWYQQDLYPMHHNFSDIWPQILEENGFVSVSNVEAIKMR